MWTRSTVLNCICQVWECVDKAESFLVASPADIPGRGVGRTSHNHQHFNEGALGVEFSTITCLDASSGPAEITVDKVVISVTSID